MADEAKSPATATAQGATAPGTKEVKEAKKPNLSPIGKVLAKLDAAILEARGVVDALGKQKADVQKAIAFAKSQNMSEKATLAIVKELVPQATPAASTGKRGRPKGSKNKAGKHKGGRGVTISEAVIARIVELGKSGELSVYAISKKVKVSPKTVAKYLEKK